MCTLFRLGVVAFLFVFALGCAPSLEQRKIHASKAISLLQDGDFQAASEAAASTLRGDAGNPYARLVRAVTRYKAAMHQFVLDAQSVVVGTMALGRYNANLVQTALNSCEAALSSAEGDLAVVADYPTIELSMCLACWQVDWNGNGQIDETDLWVAEIDLDAHGEKIPEGDPRRRPTFRFDHGDVIWARAFIAFQRAVLSLGLAFDWQNIVGIIRDGNPERIVFPLVAPEQVTAAKKRILEGLDFADRARQAFLAEDDDEREWMPNPMQQNHPLPLPVDDRLYQTWEGVIGDIRRLVRGEQGLSVKELGDILQVGWTSLPDGYIHIGCLFEPPKDLVIEVAALDDLERAENPIAALSTIFGSCYVDNLTPSPILGRLKRMKNEVDRGEEAIERKLRYLLWLN